MNRKKILILPRYEPLAASSRYRFYQYIPHLNAEGWDVTVKPLLSNNYIKYLYDKKPLPLGEILLGYFKRIIQLLETNNFDIIWLQQELFPYLPSAFEKILVRGKSKIIADYDDAFFHRYDQNKNFFLRKFLEHGQCIPIRVGEKTKKSKKINEKAFNLALHYIKKNEPV